MPAPIEHGRRQRIKRRVIPVTADPVDRSGKQIRAHAVVDLPKVRVDDVDTPSVGCRNRLGYNFRPGEERAIVLVVGAVELGGSPPMAQFAIYRVAEQPVAVGDHLPSRFLITYPLPRIPLQRLDTVGETEHQCRRHHLVGQVDVGERSKAGPNAPP